jgi:HEAT repeat protein
MAARDPQGARAAVSFLAGALKESRDPARTERCLDALGNTGHADALPTLITYASFGPESARAKAVFGLRFIDDPRVEDLLAQRLTREQPVAVRQAAVEALSLRGGPDRYAHLEEALRDPSEQVRRTVIAALATDPDRGPRWERLLSTAAREDPSERVREHARQALTSRAGGR